MSLTALVADDSKVARKIALKILGQKGFECIEAEDGKEAFELIKSRSFDLLLTDINMPWLDGFQLLAKMQKEKIHIPAVFTTGYSIREYIDFCIKYDVGTIIRKPVAEKELVSIIDKLIFKKNLFGIEQYFSEGQVNFRMQVSSTREAEILKNHIDKNVVDNMVQDKTLAIRIKLVYWEILLNALYHAHGYKEAKLNREKITLNPGQKVLLTIACSDKKIGFSIMDNSGTLSRQDVLTNLKNIFDNEKGLQRFKSGLSTLPPDFKTTGRGMIMTMRMSSDYFVTVEKNQATEIIFIFERENKPDDDGHIQLNIVEVE